jgi:prepilin peptidase CpaA
MSWMTWPPPTEYVAVLAVAIAAAVCDLKTRRIPNVLTFGAAAVALAVHGTVNGWSGLLLAASGWVVGLALFLPFFMLGGMGAGDVKLLAGLGAWLGPVGAAWTALYAACAGGLMAFVVTLAGGYTRTALRNVWTMLRFWQASGVRPVEGLTLSSSVGPRLPYALPIAVGVMVTLWKN